MGEETTSIRNCAEMSQHTRKELAAVLRIIPDINGLNIKISHPGICCFCKSLLRFIKLQGGFINFCLKIPGSPVGFRMIMPYRFESSSWTSEISSNFG
jgi:hypothetical protein